MKRIFYNGLITSIFYCSCYTQGKPNANFEKLSPKIEHVISDYIKESKYENDSDKLILVFINNNFRETKIVITASNTPMYRDTILFQYLPNNFYELDKKPILIYDGSNNIYNIDSIRQNEFDKFIAKYDKNLIEASLFNPDIWMIKIKKDLFKVIKSSFYLNEIDEKELYELSPSPPPPVFPPIKFKRINEIQ